MGLPIRLDLMPALTIMIIALAGFAGRGGCNWRGPACWRRNFRLFHLSIVSDMVKELSMATFVDWIYPMTGYASLFVLGL